MKEKLYSIIAHQLNIEPSAISDASEIIEGLGADSLDIVEILCAVEEVFAITIPDEDIIGFKTVRDVEDYLERSHGIKLSDERE